MKSLINIVLGLLFLTNSVLLAQEKVVKNFDNEIDSTKSTGTNGDINSQNINVALENDSSGVLDGKIGEDFFKSACAACHALDKKLIGPALQDVHEKYEQEWLINFIRSSQTLINNGDQQAIAIFNQNNKIIMPDQDFSNEEIITILKYIEIESEKLKTTAQQDDNLSEIKRPDIRKKTAFKPFYLKDYPILWFFIAFMISFLSITIYLIIRLTEIIETKK